MGSGWRGPDPDIRPELDKIHLIIEGHGRSFPDTTVCPKKKDYLFLNGRNSLKNC